MAANKPFAVFDIDGTVFRWQLYHELFDELFRRGVIPAKRVEPVFDARQAWQSRTIDFLDYEMALIDVMEESMIGLPVDLMDAASESVLATRGSHIYRYTTSLMSHLKEDGYTIVALSGSHQQIVERFAARHDIDIVHGRQFATKDGIFTGAGQLVYGNKAQILKSIADQHNLDWSDSYAIGDTNSDGDMMDLVTNPIAFNPDKKLYERAISNRWPIVIERKDMIYELASDGKAYTLA